MVLKSLSFPDILPMGREDFLGYPQICFVELLSCSFYVNHTVHVMTAYYPNRALNAVVA
jgi:hypothetical protein